MNVKRVCFAILVGGLVLMLFSISRAVVDTTGIKEVHKKSVLTQQDLKTIDDFMEDAVNDLVNTVNFTSVAETRAIILTYQNPSQAQYAQQYSESAYKHILRGLQTAQTFSDPAQQFKVVTNLLILVDSLKDPRLVDLAVQMIAHENSAVRYWAVRAATDATLWAKLGQSQASATQLANRIFSEAARVAERSRPEVLNLMAEFAGRYDSDQARTLLIRIADARMTQYANWTVDYELMDASILKQLCEKAVTNGPSRPELAKQFAQLYSFVIERYIKGQQQNALKEVAGNYLISVIVEVEDKCLARLLGPRTPTLAAAIQASDMNALQVERDKVLGALRSKYNFNFGTAGNTRAEPLPLPDPPARAAIAGAPPAPQP